MGWRDVGIEEFEMVGRDGVRILFHVEIIMDLHFPPKTLATYFPGLTSQDPAQAACSPLFCRRI